MWQSGLIARTLILTSLNLAIAQVQPKINYEYLDGLSDDSSPRYIVSCTCACYENRLNLSNNSHPNIQKTEVDEPNDKKESKQSDYTKNNDVSVLIRVLDPNKENIVNEYNQSNLSTNSHPNIQKTELEESNEKDDSKINFTMKNDVSMSVQDPNKENILNEYNQSNLSTNSHPNIQKTEVEEPNEKDDSKINSTMNNDVSVSTGVKDPNEANMVCEYVPSHQCFDENDAQNELASDLFDNGTDEVCCEPDNIIKSEIEITHLYVQPKRCGELISKIGGRLTVGNGKELQFEEFPWVVEIYIQLIYNNEKLETFCIGTLIHPQAVLTLANCVYGKKPEQVDVFIGGFDSIPHKRSFPKQHHNVSQIIIHKKYPETMLYDNFAILILSTPTDHIDVNILCLPDQDADFDTFHCSTIRWNTNLYESKGRMIVEAIDLPVVPLHACENDFLSGIKKMGISVDQSLICAGTDYGIDTCKTHIGTPLVCASQRDPYRYVQAGIAMGTGCNKIGDPVLYANVAAARTWITEQLASYDLDTTAFE